MLTATSSLSLAPIITRYAWLKLLLGQIPSGIDSPWSLDKTPNLPADDIAAIFKIQSWLETAKTAINIASVPQWTEWITRRKMSTSLFLTVREARWIVKLYKINYDLSEREKANSHLLNPKQPIGDQRPLIEDPYRLWFAAKAYADYERLCALTKIAFDTTQL
ncbi:MAG: hypothetical protein AABZ77_06175, partial [Chloroflexota bacterium]